MVPEASCTAEIVWDLMHGLGVEPTTTIAEALYVGLITDTGRFMYENTGPCAHVMAAELIEAGVDVHEIYRRVYEGVPYGKLALLARGLAKIERYDDGRLTLTSLTEQDFLESGAEESYSEGVIDHLRAVDGTRRRRARARPARRRRRRAPRKVSLRAGDDRVDVSAIARAQGGGGHRQAAGFTTACRARSWWRSCASELASPACSRGRPGEPLRRPPVRQAGRDHVARRGRARAPARCGRGVKVGHAGTLDPFATGLLLILVGRATRVQRFLMALPKTYEVVARFGAVSSTGDPEGEIVGDRRRPGGRSRAADRAGCASARRRTRRSRSAAGARTRCARAGEAVELAEREVEVHRFEETLARGRSARLRDRVLVGHLRAHADRRARRRVLRGAAADRGSVRSMSPTPIPSG